MRVRTLATDAGERLIGRVLGAAQARMLHIALRLGGDVGLTAEEVCEAVLDCGTAFAPPAGLASFHTQPPPRGRRHRLPGDSHVRPALPA